MTIFTLVVRLPHQVLAHLGPCFSAMRDSTVSGPLSGLNCRV